MQTAALPPGPTHRVPGGLTLEFARDPLAFFTNLARTYGDIASFKVAGDPVYFVNHPDLIREVLVAKNPSFVKGEGLRVTKPLLGEGLLTSEGDFHKRQRRLVQPSFARDRISTYATMMTDFAGRTSARWTDHGTVDMHKEMMRLTLAVVAKALFDADVEWEAEAIGKALRASIEYFNRAMGVFGPLTRTFPTPTNVSFRRARSTLDATIHRMIAERRESGAGGDDLLSRLLRAQDEGGAGMTDEQLRAESMTLFLAGHETTANALSWTWFLLSLHPEVEARLHRELTEVLDGRAPTMDDVYALPVTTRILTESMRLYPPAWILEREATADLVLGGYPVPQGSTVLLSQYVMHRDPRFYPRPEAFDPDRWTTEFRAGLPKYAYFPFGGGPRACVGEPFAWVEATLLLARLAQDWTARLASGASVAPLPRITLRPAHGIPMRLARRTR